MFYTSLSRFFCLNRASSSSCTHSGALCEKALMGFFMYSEARTWFPMHYFPLPSSEGTDTKSSWRLIFSSWEKQLYHQPCGDPFSLHFYFRIFGDCNANTPKVSKSAHWHRLQDWQTCVFTSRTRAWGELRTHHTVMDVSRINILVVGVFPIDVSDPVHLQDSSILFL